MFKLLSSSAFLTFSLLFASLSIVSAQSQATDWVPEASQWKKLNDEKVIILKNEMGKGGKDDDHAATVAVVVDFPMQAVWDVIADKKGAEDYVKNLQKVTVIEENDEYALIEQTIKIGALKKVTYVIKNVDEAPHSMTFSRHSGDLKAIDGYWKLFPIDGGNKTLVVYKLGLKPGFAVPNFMVKNSLKNSLPEALREVRQEVTRRQAKTATAGRSSNRRGLEIQPCQPEGGFVFSRI